jgi:hypothetical protein
MKETMIGGSGKTSFPASRGPDGWRGEIPLETVTGTVPRVQRDALLRAYWLLRSYATHDDACTINHSTEKAVCPCSVLVCCAEHSV